MVDKLLEKYCKVVDRWLDQLIKKEELTNDDILEMVMFSEDSYIF